MTSTFVWDASALHHPAKVHRLDLLGEYVRGTAEDPWEHLITDVVADELDRYGLDIPAWTTLVPLDTLELLTAYGAWTAVMATGTYGLGESSVAALAQVRGDVAIIDDHRAKSVAAAAGLRAHGSAWLLARAVRLGVVDAGSASSFFDASIAHGAWLPFDRFGFVPWAVRHGLLPPAGDRP